MRKILLSIILIISSFLAGNSQQQFDFDEIIAEQGDYALTMDDILIVLMSQQQLGLISTDPTEQEIQTVAVNTTKQFQLNPMLCMEGIETLRAQLKYYGPEEEYSGNFMPQDQPNQQTYQPNSTTGNLNQREVEKKMSEFIIAYYPQATLDFNSGQIVQLKGTLSGALLFNQDSDTYNSGSFGSTTVTATEMHLCQDGSMTQIISSRMAGGSEFGSYDTGEDQPLVEKGFWSIGLLNGQLAFMVTVDGATGGFPIVNEGQTIIMDGKRWNIGIRQAVCY